VSLAAETARGPLEVTSARRLKDAVAAAHAWSERARKALPGRRHRASLNRAELPTLADLARLKRDAAGLPVQPNDLQALEAAAEETTAWAAEAAALLRPARQKGKSGASSSPPTLEEAEKALVVGAAVPARCDELEALELAVEEARAWVEEAREADEADRPVEVLEALVEKATNGSLRVVPREVEALAERARVRAWADPAAKVAAGKPRVG
jgi:histone demethylase JARID1